MLKLCGWINPSEIDGYADRQDLRQSLLKIAKEKESPPKKKKSEDRKQENPGAVPWSQKFEGDEVHLPTALPPLMRQ